MPYKDPVVRREYKLAHSRLPAQRERQARLRQRPGHREYLKPIQRRSHLKKRYGITDADYHAMLAAQGGGCAICKTTEPGNGKSGWFDVDHCHTTGKVRGLLCRNCNVTAGVVEKKADLIKKIHDYLARHK